VTQSPFAIVTAHARAVFPGPPRPAPFSTAPNWPFGNFATLARLLLPPVVVLAGNAIDGNWLTFVLFKFVFFGIFQRLLLLILILLLLLLLISSAATPARFLHAPMI